MPQSRGRVLVLLIMLPIALYTSPAFAGAIAEEEALRIHIQERSTVNIFLPDKTHNEIKKQTYRPKMPIDLDIAAGTVNVYVCDSVHGYEVNNEEKYNNVTLNVYATNEVIVPLNHDEVLTYVYESENSLPIPKESDSEALTVIIENNDLNKKRR